MKKRVIHSIFFISILAVGVWVLGEFLESIALKVDPNEPKVKTALELSGQDYDVLFMGNSISQQGFNPAVADSILDINSYNMAIGGASVFTMELMLRNYMLQNKQPKAIFYGLYVNEKEWPDKVRPSILDELDERVVNEYFDTNEDVVGLGSLALYNRFKVFRYRNVIEHYLKYQLDPERFSYSYYKGFLERKEVAKPISTYRENTAGANIKALQRLMALCQKQGIALFFVELPNHKVFNDATQNRDAVLRKLDEVPYFNERYMNFNQPENYTYEDWASLNHLNLKGANKFTELFARTFKNEMRPIKKNNE